MLEHWKINIEGSFFVSMPLIHVWTVAVTILARLSYLEGRVKQIALVLLFEDDRISIDGREGLGGSFSLHILSKPGHGLFRVFLFSRTEDLPKEGDRWRRGEPVSDGFDRFEERSQGE